MTQQAQIKRPELLERTVFLLRNRPVTLTLGMISSETGLSVAWLTELATRTTSTDPSVSRIVALYEYLSGSKLQII